jgi:hypothetical protein
MALIYLPGFRPYVAGGQNPGSDTWAAAGSVRAEPLRWHTKAASRDGWKHTRRNRRADVISNLLASAQWLTATRISQLVIVN